MCDDQARSQQQEETGTAGLSRRGFMHSVGGAAAAVALAQLPRLPLRSAARAVAADGTSAYSMAMHIHSSFSEQNGSMDGHLFQATKNAVDVLWWTDHDYVMEFLNWRKTVHFTSLTAESGASGEGGAWIWTKTVSGPNASTSTGGIVTSPSSPSDPVAGGSLHVTAKSTSTSLAKFGYYADCHPAGWNYRGNLNGQTLTIDVLLTSGWSHGYLELLVATSFHPAIGGRPAANYTLSYQFVPATGQSRRFANGVNGVIVIPVKPTSSTNPWGTISITPASDIAALWPDLDYRDFALYGLTLSAASTGDQAGGYFDYLRFNRRTTGSALLQQQISMETPLKSKYPAVTQRQGLEVGRMLPHLNWFGSGVALPNYGGINTSQKYISFLKNTVVPQIHSSGGLVSYNHPYGYGQVPLLSASQQDSLLSQTASTLLPTKALSADLIEVGYRTRQGCDLAHHVGLWDVLSRNAVFLTGNGTSDDHAGTNWAGITNNFVTSAWAASTAEADLLAALAAGRAWTASLSSYRGALDILVDGTCPMGAVSVSSATTRKLVATATSIPSGGSLQVVRGTVDYAGTSAPTPNTSVVATYSASQLAGGSITQSVDTSASRFFRTQVLDSSGKVIGLSNPIWLLRSAPPNGIPARRGC
jgi:hypothetical protein